ncbi:MAG: hypothetical protein HYT87_13225 [Nitrospirae bacterium]|nr:hypothetical protein [Nitrospirota bacterium]
MRLFENPSIKKAELVLLFLGHCRSVHTGKILGNDVRRGALPGEIHLSPKPAVGFTRKSLVSPAPLIYAGASVANRALVALGTTLKS